MQCHLVTLLVAQQIKVAEPEAADGILIIVLIEISVCNECVYPVLVRRVSMLFKVSFEHLYAVLLFQFISRTGQHVIRFTFHQIRMMSCFQIIG